MDSVQDLLLPIAIALVSVVVTAIVTIQIKYASTKEEAYSGLKSAASNALYYLWVTYLIYSLYILIASPEQLTRGDAFRISVITASLFVLIIIHFMKRITSIIKDQIILHHKQIDLLEDHIKTSHQVTDNKKNENSNK